VGVGYRQMFGGRGGCNNARSVNLHKITSKKQKELHLVGGGAVVSQLGGL